MGEVVAVGNSVGTRVGEMLEGLQADRSMLRIIGKLVKARIRCMVLFLYGCLAGIQVVQIS